MSKPDLHQENPMECANCKQHHPFGYDPDNLCPTCRRFKDRSKPQGPYDPGAAHAIASYANRNPDRKTSVWV